MRIQSLKTLQTHRYYTSTLCKTIFELLIHRPSPKTYVTPTTKQRNLSDGHTKYNPTTLNFIQFT
jgi:hypothetical protein